MLILKGSNCPVWEDRKNAERSAGFSKVTGNKEELWMLAKRSLLALVLLFGLMAGTMATALAGGAPAAPGLNAAQQDDDATPEADDDSTGSRGDDSDSDVVDNVAVEVVDEGGDPSLSITVSGVNEDWDEYSDYSTPDRGFHFVYIEVTVENIGNRAADVAGYDFFIRDEQGFLYGKAYVSLAEDSAAEELGEFDPEDAIESGDSATGYIVFMVPNESTLVDAFYAPSGRLITIATFGGDAIQE